MPKRLAGTVIDSANLTEENKAEDKTLPSYWGFEKGEKLTTLDEFDPMKQTTVKGQADAKRMLKTCRAWLKSDTGWLTIIGGVGIGKTHLMKALAVEGNCYYITAYDFDHRIKQFRDSTSEGTQRRDPDDWLHDIGTMERRLIIDDVGAGYIDKGWTSIRFERLVDLRYRNQRPTAVTSNLSGKALEKALGERIMSRITDADIARVVIASNAKDIRMKRRKALSLYEVYTGKKPDAE